jgi:hypothetical protein
LFAAIPGSLPAKKRPEKAYGSGGVKKEGKGPHFFIPTGPPIEVSGLFLVLDIVKFGIAGQPTVDGKNAF